MTAKYQPCEPFRKYDRPEGRPREAELDSAMAAKIHDPLWMLARQYQFGEFQGEDTGSAIFAKVAMNSIHLSGFRNKGASFVPISEELPLETVVEKLIPPIDNKMSLRMGNRLLQLFSEAADGLPGWPEDGYRQQLAERFPFRVPEADISFSEGKLASEIRERSLRDSLLFVKALAGKALNGEELWKFLDGTPSKVAQLITSASTPDGFISPSHGTALLQAATLWKDWVLSNWNIPENEGKQAWHQETMEYNFDVAVDEGQNRTTELHADGYHHGHLDWFSFDVTASKRPRKPGEPVAIFQRSREVKALVPTEASFQGMPGARWWELEDSTVDLGNLKANDTDIATVLISQFAMKYSNDWLMIPYVVRTGTMAEVEGIVVTDTFGNKTFVEAAHKKYGGNWKEWSMYSLAFKTEGFTALNIEQRMFMPPSAAKVIEGSPVEQIRLIRDEMANMVWGIERIVPDGMGSGIDGYESAAMMDALYRQLEEKEAPEVPDELEMDYTAPTEQNVAQTTKPLLKYTLGNTITENWIPFIPVHKKNSNREIQLQRASMPRITTIKSPHQVRPRTPLLREGINNLDSQDTPYYLYEEEVPRAGATITGAFQRTRWYDGRVVTWYGRQKATGRGEGSSGLRFDFISDNY